MSNNYTPTVNNVMKGDYAPMIVNIINEYLVTNYGLDMDKVDYVAKNILTNCNIVYNTNLAGIDFFFSDLITSRTVNIVTNEINMSNEYDFRNMDFKKGDVVVDIGGNIGMISIFLAKKYPFLRIYAFEPVRQNYENFLKNIELNKIPPKTITLENKAVTSDGRVVNMKINPLNTGGSSISDIISVGGISQDINNNVQSISLNGIFNKYNIKKLSLLKIDCEGAEYEILYNTNRMNLKKISKLRGEFHENRTLTNKYNAEKLHNYVSKYINDVKVVMAGECFIM